MIKQFVLASHNAKKTAEMRAILAPLGIDLLNLTEFPGAPEPEEDGDTFEDNAIIKAKSALAYTGLASLADDSGLMVEALDGRPGVYSARFAGDGAGDAANNALLLKELDGVPPAKRGAKFVSAVALAIPEREVRVFRGETHGVVLDALRGTNGFGYDPLFLSGDLGVTFAEAASEAKNKISHRARAMSALREWLVGECL